MPNSLTQAPMTLFGMDYSRRVDLLPVEQWRLQYNLRTTDKKIVQVPRKARLYSVQVDERISHIGHIPTRAENYVIPYALTDSRLVRLGASSVTTLYTGFSTSTEFARWSTDFYNGHDYFINPWNELYRFDGAAVSRLTSNGPKAYYCHSFQDHVLLGRISSYKGETLPYGVRWGHIKTPSSYDSSSSSTADFFNLRYHRRDEEQVSGVTGIKKLHGGCFVYTPSAIFVVTYVGKDKGVFRFDDAILGLGSGYLYGLLSSGVAHFFVDPVERNFFMFTGQAPPEAFGDPIRDYFFNDINTDPTLAQRLWGYIDPGKRELVWVYCSTASTGAYDKAVRFSWADKAWYVSAAEDISAYHTSMRLARLCSEITENNSAITSTCIGLGRTSSTIAEIWGSSYGQVLRGEVAGDNISTLLAQDNPVLETRDFVWNDLFTLKYAKSVLLHSYWTSCTGVKVYVSVRDNIEEAVTWVDMGTWKYDDFVDPLTFQNVEGRVVRFKFEFVKIGDPVSTAVEVIPGGSVGIITPVAYDFSSFLNWNVTEHTVDIIGDNGTSTLDNFLPGNGVYVDMLGTTDTGLSGTIISKSSFTLVNTSTYRLTITYAGSQRSFSALTDLFFKIGTSLDVSVNNILYTVGFTTVTYDISGVDDLAPIYIRGYGQYPTQGPLIKYVKLEQLTPTAITLLEDNFLYIGYTPGTAVNTNLLLGGGCRGITFAAFVAEVYAAGSQR